MKKALAVFSMLLLIFLPTAPFINSQTAKASYAVTVRVVPENSTVKLGQPFTVNVTFEYITYNRTLDDGVFGCQFNLTWNASILRAVSMQEIAFHMATPLNEWWNIWCLRHDVSNSCVNYAYCWYYTDRAYEPLIGNGNWATITFTSLAPGKGDLHFSTLKIGSIAPFILGIGVDGKVSVTNILAGDINQDKTVDSVDASVLSSAFGSTPDETHGNSVADINSDNIVDIYDAMILSANYGKNTL